MRRLFFLALIVASLTSISVFAGERDDDYDRLDGHGRSGKKVHVIEWEGNLEIHVYPGGSTRGLALKLDDRNPDKKVMVIGYRFHSNPEIQLVRRAILGIPLESGFKVYQDPRSGKEYDKFVVMNGSPGGALVGYRLEPGPSQLYPDGHPALAENPVKTNGPRQPASRAEPASGLDEETGAIRSKGW